MEIPWDFIWDIVKKVSKKYYPWKWKRLRNKQATSRGNKLLYQFLDYLYGGYPILKDEENRIWPLVVFPADKSQRDDLESTLIELDPILEEEQLEPFIAKEGEKYLNLRKKTGAKLYNLSTYCMVNLHRDSTGPKLSCKMGEYFNAVKTCDILEIELLRKFNKIGSNLAKRKYTNEEIEDIFNNFFFKELNLRRILHNKVKDPICNGSFRSTAVAISTLIVAFDKNKGCYRTLIDVRSQKVAVHSDLLHVIPSFMFQPLTSYYKKEFSIQHNIFREYLEEIFDYKELERPSKRYPESFYNFPELKYLVSFLATGEAKILTTGVSVNLLNLRPEICTLLLVESPEYYETLKKGGKRKIPKIELFLKEGSKTNGKVKPSKVGWEISRTEEEVELKSVRINEEYLAPGVITAEELIDFNFETFVSRLQKNLTEKRRELEKKLQDKMPIEVPQALFVPPGAAALYLGLKVLRDLQ